MDEQQFVQLLESILAPDTDRVKAATASLRKNYYSHPAALTFLIQLLSSHDSPQLRQLAALQARTLVPRHWPSIPSDQQALIRSSLLQTTLNEQATLVRHSSARVISAIAKIDLADGEWADLPSFLQQAATSANAAQREVGIYILFTLLEVIGDEFTEKTAELYTLFAKTIRDPESVEVRINTMLALSKLATIIDTEDDQVSLARFQETFPSMVAVLKQAVDAGEETQIMQAFEVFQTLLACDAQLMANHFKDLVQFMIDLAVSKNLASESRSQALSFLMQCVKYRGLKIQGLRFGEQLTLKSLMIATELDDREVEVEDISPAATALGLLDILAQRLPPSQVIVPLLRALPDYVNNPDADFRRAGILALGMCVEGAPEFLSTQMNEIFPPVLRLLADPEMRVRQAALHAVARLADDLAEEIGKEHQKLIPALLKNLDAATAEVSSQGDMQRQLDIIKAAFGALDSVFEGIEKEDAASYIGELAPRLSRFFAHPDFKVKASAVSAMGTVAAASEEAFMPYFEGTMTALAGYVTMKDSPEELDLRGTVCDAMGSIASAVGAVPFKPYVQPLMQASEEAIHLDHPRLRETSYILWSTLCKVYKEDFTPFLDGVFQGLMQSLQQEESDQEIELSEEAMELLNDEIVLAGSKIKIKGVDNEKKSALKKEGLIPAAVADDEDVDFEDVDEDDDDEDWDGVTAVAYEKEIALDVIGDVISYTRGKYLPYLEKTVEVVLSLVEHSYEGVRKASVGTVWRAYTTLWQLSEEGQMEKWKPGLPLAVQPTPELVKLGEVAMTATLMLWQIEMDRGTITDINQNLASTLKACGPAILVGDNIVEQVTTNILSIFRKQHPCQQDLGDEEEVETLEESSEYDFFVIDTAMDVVIGLAAALGPQFRELWKIFEKPMLKFASGSDAIERSSSVGALAGIISGMGEAITPNTTVLLTTLLSREWRLHNDLTVLTQTLLALLLRRLGDEDPKTKSNAAYAIGLLCFHSSSSAEVLKAYNTILAKLEPMLRQDDARMIDNSAGCVSRMIMAHPEHVPIEEVLPALVGVLPLKTDYEENEPIWEMIVKLYQSNNPHIRQQTARLVPILEHVLGPPSEQLTDETREKVVQLVKYLHQHQPDLIKGHATLIAAVGS